MTPDDRARYDALETYILQQSKTQDRGLYITEEDYAFFLFHNQEMKFSVPVKGDHKS
jgi:hypothetical protein